MGGRERWDETLAQPASFLGLSSTTEGSKASGPPSQAFQDAKWDIQAGLEAHYLQGALPVGLAGELPSRPLSSATIIPVVLSTLTHCPPDGPHHEGYLLNTGTPGLGMPKTDQ